MAKVAGSLICTFYHNGQAKVMVIDSVEVKKDQRKKGFGTTLIDEAIKIAKKRKVDSIEMVVNSDNTVAKKLYEKAGFKKTEKVHYRLILNKFKNE
jgi:ribosomal protein S18 acetylase RimI-like enzyme